MSLQNIPIERITFADLQALKDAAVRESRTIDYKKTWQLSDEASKKEFIADVASFANAGGGDIVYGISEAAGVPDAIVGLSGFDFDKEMLRAQSLLASWIDPRVAGASFRLVERVPETPVLVVRVPRSWNGPHMVTYNGYNRFFSRNANGKYEMDVRELKDAFLSASGRSARLRDFRLDRISRIAANDVGVRLASNYAVALHLLPLGELPVFDYSKILTLQQKYFWPIGNGGCSPRINFDGCMFANERLNDVLSYLQIFRDGAIEAVVCSPRTQEAKEISQGYEFDVRERIPQLMSGLMELGVGPPFILGLAHVNVTGMTMHIPPTVSLMHEPRAFDRQHIIVPEAVIEDISAPIDIVLKPIFDIVWNACGIRSSRNYSQDGTWNTTGNH